VLELILELLLASELFASSELPGGGRVDCGVADCGAVFGYDRRLFQWSVVSGQWSVVSGQWSVISNQWVVGVARFFLPRKVMENRNGVGAGVVEFCGMYWK